MYKAISNLYRWGRITADGVKDAAAKGLITAAQASMILGEVVE